MAYFHFVNDYIGYYNSRRSHLGINHQIPENGEVEKCRKCFTNIPFMRQPQNDINY